MRMTLSGLVVALLVVSQCALATAAETGAAKFDSRTTAAASAASEWPLHVAKREMSLLMKSEATARSPVERGAVIEQLCELHARMVSDERFATSDTLKSYRAQIYSRLVRVQNDLKRQLALEARQPVDEQTVEASRLSQAIGDAVSHSLARQQQVVGDIPQFVALGGAPVPADYGRSLVELIERTINPAFWDTNGGPGTIVYYAPLQCLVVRATSEVHGRVGGVVEDLRAAGE